MKPMLFRQDDESDDEKLFLQICQSQGESTQTKLETANKAMQQMSKKEFDVGFLCEQEARAGDETMYVITMLQAKLDRAKIQNHVAL